MKLTIYHNSKCSKCQGTLDLIQDSRKEYQLINYLENPPSPSELDQLLIQLGMEPEQIVRKTEDVYEKLGLQNMSLSRGEWLEVLSKNPILIERPIVTNGSIAVIGRPPENVKKLLN